jgi:predicted membrane channel-forming protein YqfA (hemolysin III family)
MLRKIGSFILLVGGTFLVLFVLSIAANAVDYNLLVSGGLIFLFGLFFYWISPRQPSAPSERFRSIRKKDRPDQKNKKS